jgi:hypothetical protein
MRLMPACCALLLLACNDASRSEGDAPAGAARAADSATAAAPDDMQALSTMDCGVFQDSALRVRPSRAALREAFGEPDSVRGWTEPNRHVPDVVDSLFVVRYPGLDVSIRRPYGGLDMADFAAVRENRYLARPALGMGVPAAEVVRVLGAPAERSDTLLRYDCGEVGMPVIFRMSGGAVTALELDYYVD